MVRRYDASFTDSRRRFMAATAMGSAVILSTASTIRRANAQDENEIEVLMPRHRVPLSFIIDDSTCLVNMGHFCTPQFAAAWPDNREYHKPWQQWPREIPDAFVREFGEWCAEHQVKGKYSIVPYPACVGWLDRELPGWSRAQLDSSLSLVRDLMLPNWDIHPGMITHTRIIDLASGRPLEPVNPSTMENSFPRVKLSVDALATYLAYALRILRNVGLPCEGITTPGGFGTLMKTELSLAAQQALRDVFQVEIPHYFKYVREGDESTEPVLEHVHDEYSQFPLATVNVPAGTGDWFGGWQGDEKPQGQMYLSDDGQHGRMAELIQRKSPAVMLCHWPGMYCNGRKTGFKQLQKIAKTLNSVYRDQTQWMKLSEMARYWAAKSWTRFESAESVIRISAPIGTKQFTIRCPILAGPIDILQPDGSVIHISEVDTLAKLVPGTCYQEATGLVICFDLSKGDSSIQIQI